VTLCTDARGAGGSEGKKEDASFDELGADALAAVAYLRSRPEVGGGKVVGLMGHSQGADIATLAARADHSIGFLVRLSGTAVTGKEVLLEQTRQVLTASAPAEPQFQAFIESLVSEKRRLYDLAIEGSSESEIQHKMTAWCDEQRAGRGPDLDLIHAAAARLMRSELAYDPAADLRQLRCPILDVRGDVDPFVPPEQNLPPLRRALAESGNEDATIKVFRGLSHELFHSHPPGVHNDRNELFAEEVREYVVAWLQLHAERKNGEAKKVTSTFTPRGS